jgi:hypothetical protein
MPLPPFDPLVENGYHYKSIRKEGKFFFMGLGLACQIARHLRDITTLCVRRTQIAAARPARRQSTLGYV